MVGERRLIHVPHRILPGFLRTAPFAGPASSAPAVSPMNTDDPLPTRRSLLKRLKNTADQASWEEFDRMYRGLLRGVARRSGLNELETSEAVQETLITVAKKLPEFHYQPGKDSFKGWLLQIVRWKVSDQLRQRPPTEVELAGDGESKLTHLEDTAEAPHDFEMIWNTEWERHLVSQALARVKRQVNPEHYAIYHLHVIEAHTASEVRQILGVGIAAIYLAKHRVGSAVQREVQKLRLLDD